MREIQVTLHFCPTCHESTSLCSCPETTMKMLKQENTPERVLELLEFCIKLLDHPQIKKRVPFSAMRLKLPYGFIDEARSLVERPRENRTHVL